jgi:predicted dithiol-disulfide oxidoreductase (DUF899 family)
MSWNYYPQNWPANLGGFGGCGQSGVSAGGPLQLVDRDTLEHLGGHPRGSQAFFVVGSMLSRSANDFLPANAFARVGTKDAASSLDHDSQIRRLEIMAMAKVEESAEIAEAKRQNEASLATHRVAPADEWRQARVSLLQKEKAMMKLQDELSALQRGLPWTRVAEDYTFTTLDGDVSLSGLFGPHSQLFIKHFMMGPQQDWQCPGCTLEVAHVDGLLEYFEHHDMAYVAVARAPIDEIEAVRRRMNWKFKWVSSSKSNFNYDFNVSFRANEKQAGTSVYNYRPFNSPGTEDLSGNSIFYKNPRGEVFHTYSTFGRGGEQFLGIYGFFDVLPKGREEYGPTHSLPDWAGFKTRSISDCPAHRSGQSK